MNGRIAGMRVFPVAPEGKRVHSIVPESRREKNAPAQSSTVVANAHRVTPCASAISPIRSFLSTRLERQAASRPSCCMIASIVVPYRSANEPAEPFDAAGNRHLAGLLGCRVAADPGVDSDRGEPDVTTVCGEFYEEREQSRARSIARQHDGNMVARAQPSMRTDGAFGLGLKILKKMHRAEMLSRIGLENERLAPARIALHRGTDPVLIWIMRDV